MSQKSLATARLVALVPDARLQAGGLGADAAGSMPDYALRPA
jgi:hypothetical protein